MRELLQDYDTVPEESGERHCFALASSVVQGRGRHGFALASGGAGTQGDGRIGRTLEIVWALEAKRVGLSNVYFCVCRRVLS